MLKEASFYKKKGDKVLCNLCPHNCCLSNGQLGICRSRMVSGGKLYSLNYGEITSINLENIKKDLLFKAKSGTDILSVGSFGCNFKCEFCKNHNMFQKKVFGEYLSPEQLIDLALNIKNNTGIAFTYNEPSVWYEYIYDVCKKSKSKPIDIVLFTNGYINREALETLLPYLSAINIDLKAFNKSFYKDICFGEYDTVIENIKFAAKRCPVEITNTIIEGYNDSFQEIEAMCKWIANVDENIPLHMIRYHSNCKLKVADTSTHIMNIAENIAKRYLKHVTLEKQFVIDNHVYKYKYDNTIIKNTYFPKDLLGKISTLVGEGV